VAAIIPVSDADDPRIAAYRDVRERDLRGRDGLFVAEGEVVVRVLLTQSLQPPVSLLLAEKRVTALAREIASLPEGVPVFVAPQAVMDGIVGFPIHRGILALGRRNPAGSADALLRGIDGPSVVLGLIGIANHDNMGGIFRNAAAFGVSAVFLDGACCDPLYRKAIRVSAGHALCVPFARLGEREDMLALLERHGFAPMALAPRAERTIDEITRPDRAALLLGAEGHGLPDAVLQRTTGLRIPMAPDVDSLNVAVTSGIVLHHFHRG